MLTFFKDSNWPSPKTFQVKNLHASSIGDPDRFINNNFHLFTVNILSIWSFICEFMGPPIKETPGRRRRGEKCNGGQQVG